MRIRLSFITLSALLSLTPIAHADAPPARKSGLWETTVTMDRGMPSQKIKECVDSTTDAEMMKRPCEGCNHIKWQVGHLISFRNVPRE